MSAAAPATPRALPASRVVPAVARRPAPRRAPRGSPAPTPFLNPARLIRFRSIVAALVLASSSALVLEFDPTFVGNNTVHYGDPKNGCMADEESVQIQGVSGDVCTPKCSLLKKCPTDVPTGVTVAPQCALQDAATKSKYCALICKPGADDDAQCGGATCQKVQLGLGICTYAA